jgi:hypothetical protein
MDAPKGTNIAPHTLFLLSLGDAVRSKAVDLHLFKPFLDIRSTCCSECFYVFYKFSL